MEQSKAKIIKAGLFAFGVVLVAASAFIFLENRGKKAAPISGQSVPAVQEKKERDSASMAAQNNQNQLAVVQNAIDSEELSSENYKAKQISFGGDAVLVADASERLPLEVYDVRTETFIQKDGNSSKAVLNWKSNKLTISEISYSKSSGQSPKIARETSYGFNHSVVLSDLEPATSFTYKIKSSDRWGNRNETNYFGFYSGSKPISVFDLINKNLHDIFSWAIK